MMCKKLIKSMDNLADAIDSLVEKLDAIRSDKPKYDELSAVSWQLKRMADAWCQDKSEKKDDAKQLTPAQREVRTLNASQPKWSAEEDELLLKMVDLIGTRWEMISRTGKFPGRSASALGSRYNNCLKNKR